MKRIAIFCTALSLLILGQTVVSAQNTKGNAKNTKKGTTAAVEKKAAELVTLPSNSNDCLFAIELQPDVMYGPTTAPKGAGRIQEIMRDKANPQIFEYEHNSVWYKFVVPYTGNLEVEITPLNEWDDYDFVVYKYSDVYFSNHLIQNKIKPIASSLAKRDTTGMSLTMVKDSKGQVRQKPRKTPLKPALGMKTGYKKTFVGENDRDEFLSSIPVKKGEEYYIVLDNKTNNGDGHTIKVSIQVETFDPMVMFYDPKLKKNIDVDLLILEKNTNNRPIVKTPSFRSGKVKFVPGFTYSLYAKRDGYFNVYKEFNSNIFKDDTLLGFIMNRTEKGTVFQLTDIYFDDDAKLLPESDSSLLNYMQMFREHPEISFQIKGFVQSYAVDIESEQKLSIARAQSVKDFFVAHGIPAENITIAGMTVNEIKRAAAAALYRRQAFKETKVELTITNIQK